MHSRQRATVEHSLVTMQELQSPASKGRRNSVRRDQSRERCSVHSDQQLDLFCKTCGIVVCSKCALAGHAPPAHALVSATEAAAEAATKMSEIIGRCVKALALSYETRSDMRRKRKLLQDDADKAILAIESWHKEIEEYAQAKALEAKECVLQVKEAEECVWDTKEDEATRYILTMEDLLRFSSAARETPSLLKFIEIEASLLRRLEHNLAAPQPRVSGDELHNDLLPHKLRKQAAESDLKRVADLLLRQSYKVSMLSTEADTNASSLCGEEEQEERVNYRQSIEKAAVAERSGDEVARRKEMEATIAALREASDEQTDMIVSLESDMRRALEARDILQERLLQQQESAAVAEIERIVSLEAECTRLRNALEVERSSALNLEDSLLQGGRDKELGAGGGAGCGEGGQDLQKFLQVRHHPPQRPGQRHKEVL